MRADHPDRRHLGVRGRRRVAVDAALHRRGRLSLGLRHLVAAGGLLPDGTGQARGPREQRLTPPFVGDGALTSPEPQAHLRGANVFAVKFVTDTVIPDTTVVLRTSVDNWTD